MSFKLMKFLRWTLCVYTILGFGRAQSVYSEYKRFFMHYEDRRSMPEKALNLVGLTSLEVGRSFALIAGVTRYPSLPSIERELRPAEADLQHLQTYLKDQEFFDEIVVLKNADMTYNNLRYFLEVYFPERLKQSPRSRFLFGYSGHGITEGSAGYLLTSAADSMQDKRNSINLDSIRVLVDSTVDAGHQILVLINACYSGAFLRRSFGSNTYVPKYPGAHAITAGGAKEQSWHDPRLGEGSVFFEKLFAGLDGQADIAPVNPGGTRGDGVVTVDELATYLKQEISISSDQHQNPMAGDISKNGSLGGFFFLNRQRQVTQGIVKHWNAKKLKPLGLNQLAESPRAAVLVNVLPSQHSQLMKDGRNEEFVARLLKAGFQAQLRGSYTLKLPGGTFSWGAISHPGRVVYYNKNDEYHARDIAAILNPIVTTPLSPIFVDLGNLRPEGSNRYLPRFIEESGIRIEVSVGEQ